MSRLYVGGLDRSADENMVRAAFIPFGEILRVEMPRDREDGPHRGYAYIEFEDPDDAQEAQYNMHDSELLGRTLVVNKAHGRGGDAARGGGPGRAVWDTLAADESQVDAERLRRDVASGRSESGRTPSGPR